MRQLMLRPSLLVAVVAACSPGDQPGDDDAPAAWSEPLELLDGSAVEGLAVSANGDAFTLGNARVRRWTRDEGAWSGATTVPGVTTERIAPDGSGGLLAVGQREDGTMAGGQFAAGGDWPDGWARVDVTGPTPNLFRISTALASAEDGSAAIGWVEFSNGVPGYTRRIAVREGHGPWSAPIVVEGLDVNAEPLLAVAQLPGELRVVALWSAERGGEGVVAANVLRVPHGGQPMWQGAARIASAPLGSNPYLALRIARTGDATALMFHGEGHISLVHYTGAWGAPVDVVDAEGARDVALAVEPEGPVVVGWTRCRPDCVVALQRWTPAGFGPITFIGTNRSPLPIALAASGTRALVVWGTDNALWTRELVGDTLAPAQRHGEAQSDDRFAIAFYAGLRDGAIGAASWSYVAGDNELRTWLSVISEP